jgi:hypothetical protein
VRKLIICLASILLGTPLCLAQKNYQSGYVIGLRGDTVRGFIERKNWDRNPIHISFKQHLSSETIRYGPHDIRSLCVGSELYESAVIDVDTSPNKIADLDGNALPVYVRDTVFLQALFRGDKSLFHFKDVNARSHFYIKEDGYVHLVYKEYLTSLFRFDNYETKVAENLKYKGQLILYLKDCQDISSRMHNLKYQTHALIELFKYYYQCASKPAEFVNNLKEGTTSFGIMLGVSNASIDLGYKSGLSYLNLSKSTDPTIGLFYEFEMTRIKGLSLTNDLFYTLLSTDGTVTRGGGGTVESTTDATFKIHYIKTNHIVRLNLLKKGRLYIGAGLSTGFVIKKEYSIVETYSTGLVTSPVFESKPLELGYVAGIGTNIGKLSIEGRFDSTDGITNNSSTQRMLFLLRYRLLSRLR